jgi:hypothetical protein
LTANPAGRSPRRTFPNRHCQSSASSKYRPTNRLIHTYKEPRRVPHLASHRHGRTSLLPRASKHHRPTTIVGRCPTPRSRLPGLSSTEVREGIGSPRPPLRFHHLLAVAMAGSAANRRRPAVQSRSPPLLCFGSRGGGRRRLFS